LLKKKFRVFALILAVWMVFFNPVNLSLVYAQDATPTDTPVATDSPSPDPTDTPTDSPTDTPTPTPTATPDQSMTTGDATSSGDSTTGSNISDISTTPTPIATDSATPDPEATDSATPTDTPKDTPTPTPSDISVDQSGITNTNTTSSADSGNNSQQDSTGSASMTTGNAGSTANSITVANLSEVNSNLITVVQNILTSDSGDVNLYQDLMSAIANNPNLVPQNTNITVNQIAGVNTNTDSSANSGNNSQNAGSNSMTTGNAISLANAINAVNLNLVGSNVVITIINILADWNGNIILPNGTQMSLSSPATGNVTVNSNQIAQVSSNTSSAATSGENSQTGGATTMTTGNSTSVANSANLVNVIEIGNGLGFLVINNSGNWTGNLVNWSAPGSVQSLGNGNYNLLTNYGGTGSGPGTGNTTITSNQIASVNTNVSSSATTGGNTQSGGVSSLTTGNSTSLANNFTLANLTSVGGGFFFGIINIVGKWTGNAIAAYPELNVSVTDNQDNVNPGGAENYVVSVTNAGHAIAHGVSLGFTFPGEVSPDGPENLSQNLGNLDPGQTQTFDWNGHVSGSAQGGTQLLASASVSTADTQDSTSGDTGSDTTNIVLPPDPGPNTETPILETDIWDSVGAYIYPGDTIWASITVHNNSPVIARSLNVNGDIKDPNGKIIAPLSWQIGDIKPSGKVKISFNVTIPKNSVPGIYHFKASASGQSESGNSVTSNLAETDFWVKLPVNAGEFITPPVLGASTGQISGGTPQVLGLNTQVTPFNINNLAPYAFPLLAGLYLLLVAGRRRLLGEPIVSPVFAGFFKKRKAFLAGGFSIILIAVGLFLKRKI
jgi:hypothetical protein